MQGPQVGGKEREQNFMPGRIHPILPFPPTQSQNVKGVKRTILHCVTQSSMQSNIILKMTFIVKSMARLITKILLARFRPTLLLQCLVFRKPKSYPLRHFHITCCRFHKNEEKYNQKQSIFHSNTNKCAAVTPTCTIVDAVQFALVQRFTAE